MRIDNHKLFTSFGKNVNEYKASKKGEWEGVTPKDEAVDSIQVSKNAIDMNRFLDMVAEDEIRVEKVERIRKEMENGTYSISGKDVMAKLLGGDDYGKGIDSTVPSRE